MSFQAFNLGKATSKRVSARSKFDTDSDEEELPQAPAGSQTASHHQEAGDRAAAAGQWGQALQHWDAALASSPPDAYKLHEQKAQVWLEVGEDWKAVQCAQRAVELRPDWAEGHLTLSRAQLNFGEPELALKSLQRVLQLHPAHPEAASEITAVQVLVLRRQQAGASGRLPMRDTHTTQHAL